MIILQIHNTNHMTIDEHNTNKNDTNHNNTDAKILLKIVVVIGG